jgi:DNA-binding SARP family transcriptional activator
LAVRLRELGCRRLAAEATALTSPLAAPPPELEITTLGGFGVRQEGEPVPHTAWQSRKARDLLKVLVVRRGALVPRDQLVELLWPDDDPAKAARRLSVTLSTLRAVLDPQRRQAADHWVVADSQSVRLDRDHAVIDVERFLSDAEQALQLPSGHPDQVPALLAAEAQYVGDLLEEDVYEEWTVALREWARDTYLRVAGALSALATARGDHDDATRFERRVLERDRYDEGAHLGLVRALAAGGHHGAARRAYRVYVQRMGELDVEAVPYPAPGRDPNDA